MTTTDDSTLNGDEAFEEAWSVFRMLMFNVVYSDAHVVMDRKVWIDAIKRMEIAKDRLAEHHKRFSL